MFNAADIAAFVQSKSSGGFLGQFPRENQRQATHRTQRTVHAKKRPAAQRLSIIPLCVTGSTQGGASPSAMNEVMHSQESSPRKEAPAPSTAIGAFSSTGPSSPEFINKYSLHSPLLSHQAGHQDVVVDTAEQNWQSPGQAPLRLESNMPTYDAQSLYNIITVPDDDLSVEMERPLPPQAPRPLNARRVGAKHIDTSPQSELRRFEVDKVEFTTFTTEEDGDIPALLPITTASISAAAQEVLLASKANDSSRRQSLLPPKSIHGEGGEAALKDLRREIQAQADKVLHLQTQIAAEKLREQLAAESKHSDETAGRVLGYKSTYVVETSAIADQHSSNVNTKDMSILQPPALSPNAKKARDMLSSVEQALRALEEGPIKQLQLSKNTNDEFTCFMADVHGTFAADQSDFEKQMHGWTTQMAGSGSDKPWADKHASINAMLAAAERYSSAATLPLPKLEVPQPVRKLSPQVDMPSDERNKPMSSSAPQLRFESPIAQSREHDRTVEMVRNTAREALNRALNTSGSHWPPAAPQGRRSGGSRRQKGDSYQRSVSPPRPKSMSAMRDSQPAPMADATAAASAPRHPPPSAVLRPEAWTQPSS